jgi:DNA-directed RNA polymerase specialized sigma24 family protein
MSSNSSPSHATINPEEDPYGCVSYILTIKKTLLKESEKMVALRQSNLNPDKRTNSVFLNMPFAERDGVELNTSLEEDYMYLVKMARIHIPRNMVSPEEFEDEIEELAQKAFISYWLRLRSKGEQIKTPKAYLTQVMRSRSIDMIRQRKSMPTSPLLLDQEGEMVQSNAVPLTGSALFDPVAEYERKEMITEVIDDMLKLPAMQRYAMICVLKDEVGDTYPLEEAFRKHGINIKTINWPKDPVESQKLRSSLSVARKKLRALKDKYAIA